MDLSFRTREERVLIFYPIKQKKKIRNQKELKEASEF
jgi:hypothetical protein